jgi:hypothetical protein
MQRKGSLASPKIVDDDGFNQVLDRSFEDLTLEFAHEIEGRLRLPGFAAWQAEKSGNDR